MRRRIPWIAAAIIGAAGVASAAAVIDDEAAEALSGAESEGGLTAALRLPELLGRGDDAEPGSPTWDTGSPAALLVAATPHELEEPPSGALRAQAYQYVSRVFDRPRARPKAIGFVRRNQVLRAAERASGPGCDGAWYQLAGDGYVCSGDGFAISREPRPVAVRQPEPAVERALPYDYGKAKPGVLRFHDVPTDAEEQAIASAIELDQRLPDVVDRSLDGIFLLALDRSEEHDGREFYRTVRGRYVRKADVDDKPEPGMRGELLDDDNRLPLAFVYGEPAPVRRLDDGEAHDAGTAEVHSRFHVAAEVTHDGVPMVVDADGFAVERARVRLVKARARPEGVGPDEKWIHVNHDEQALVAYEGDRPVFATLVSSGKGAEFATPTGLFQVREKHISTTMSGADPDEGYYEVEEVPWTQYYHDSYALHGAYWHDDFGKTRSHGCTNISPVDARWLFYWTDGVVPAGWNAIRKLEATWVYMTRDLPPQ